MPVHSAGSRLYRSVPFKVLGKGPGLGIGRASNVSLNLVPFVDMMTILVCFLLMVFSAETLIQAQEGLELPEATKTNTLQSAPVIIVTKSEITYNGQLIATVDSVLKDDSPTNKVDALFERLEAAAKTIKVDVADDRIKDPGQRKACQDFKQGIRPAPGKPICPEGLAILQADKTTDARVINKVVNTAKMAGFDNLLFAAKNPE
jgi:biopolymer transport protein ExbD